MAKSKSKIRKARLRLTVDVVYILNKDKEADLIYQLRHAASFLASAGLLSGEGTATVDSWEHEVVVVNKT